MSISQRLYSLESNYTVIKLLNIVYLLAPYSITKAQRAIQAYIIQTV